jgi:hypothetical protein
MQFEREIINFIHLIYTVDNINSRHPVILGLRNILKTACLNEVTTITVPALLAHQMTEVVLLMSS